MSRRLKLADIPDRVKANIRACYFSGEYVTKAPVAVLCHGDVWEHSQKPSVILVASSHPDERSWSGAACHIRSSVFNMSDFVPNPGITDIVAAAVKTGQQMDAYGPDKGYD